MSIDIDKIKSKLNKLQNKNSRRNSLWKPSEGEQIIRIVPYKENPSNPFIELYFHYDFGGANFVSPVSYGDPDPIHEFSQELRKQGDRESYIQSKKFEPTMRTFVPVLVRGEEDQGIRYWGFGKLVYEQLLGYIADPDYGDITHPETGRDIKVEFEKPDTGYPKTTIRVKPNKTKAMEDLSELKKLIEKQPDIKELYEPMSYSDLKQKLNNYLNGASDDEDETSQETTDSSESDNKKAPFDSDEDDVTSDVEKTFEDLFNE